MKNYFASNRMTALIAIVLSVFFVVVTVQAATTIGTDVTTSGVLTVSGTATSTFSTGGLTVGTSQFVVQQTSGNVGIGTTTPGTDFAVSGLTSTGVLNVFNTSATSSFDGGMNIMKSVSIGTKTPAEDGLYIKDIGATSDRTSITLDTSASPLRRRALRYDTAGVLRWSVDTDNAAESGSNAGSIFGINRYDDSGNYLSTPFAIIRSNEYTRLGTTGGRVMIGGNAVTAPANMLSVVGAMAIGTNYGQNNAAPTNGLLVEGIVGIGTTTPPNMLTVAGINQRNGEIGFTSTSSASTAVNYWALGIDYSDAGKFKISSSTSVSINPRLTIDSNGNIGIGTTTQTTQLQVTASASNATTTVTIGKVGQNKGSCLELFDSAGTAVYAYVAAGATAFTLSATSCK